MGRRVVRVVGEFGCNCLFYAYFWNLKWLTAASIVWSCSCARRQRASWTLPDSRRQGLRPHGCRWRGVMPWAFSINWTAPFLQQNRFWPCNMTAPVMHGCHVPAYMGWFKPSAPKPVDVGDSLHTWCLVPPIQHENTLEWMLPARWWTTMSFVRAPVIQRPMTTRCIRLIAASISDSAKTTYFYKHV